MALRRNVSMDFCTIFLQHCYLPVHLLEHFSACLFTCLAILCPVGSGWLNLPNRHLRVNPYKTESLTLTISAPFEVPRSFEIILFQLMTYSFLFLGPQTFESSFSIVFPSLSGSSNEKHIHQHKISYNFRSFTDALKPRHLWTLGSEPL